MTPYRAVIGLAGHVDHGKTLLIKASPASPLPAPMSRPSA